MASFRDLDDGPPEFLLSDATVDLVVPESKPCIWIVSTYPAGACSEGTVLIVEPISPSRHIWRTAVQPLYKLGHRVGWGRHDRMAVNDVDL